MERIKQANHDNVIIRILKQSCSNKILFVLKDHSKVCLYDPNIHHMCVSVSEEGYCLEISKHVSVYPVTESLYLHEVEYVSFNEKMFAKELQSINDAYIDRIRHLIEEIKELLSLLTIFIHLTKIIKIMLTKFIDKWGDPVAVNPNEVVAVTVNHTHDKDCAELVSTHIHVDMCAEVMIIPVKEEFHQVVDTINANLD